MSATWTNPTDRTQGDLISASDWNNLIGEDGSLDYANNLRGRKNLVMNGDFRIAQRGSSFSPLPTGDYAADRWNWQYNTFSGAVDSSISTDTPDIFGSSLKLDCTTADASVAASNFVLLRTHWEGQDVQQLAYGTSNARSVTISFWIKSTKTGTFNVSLYNNDATYSYIVDVTINSASTWEKKTITIAGDTANGFDNDNNRSLSLYFTFSAGTDYQGTSDSWISGFKIASSNIDNFFDSTSNEIYLTGIQMEIGTVATDFEVRPIAEELALCQRYYYRLVNGNAENIGIGYYYQSTTMICVVFFPTQMRAVPTMTNSSGTNYYRIVRDGSSDYFNAFTSTNDMTTKQTALACNSGVSGTAGQAGRVATANANAYIEFDAEL